MTSRGAVALLFLIVAGTVLGFGAYTWLLRVTTPAAVGTYAFVNPVVALILAWGVGDEPFSGRTSVAGVTVLLGVMLIWKSTSRAQRRQESLTEPMRHREPLVAGSSGSAAGSPKT